MHPLTSGFKSRDSFLPVLFLGMACCASFTEAQELSVATFTTTPAVANGFETYISNGSQEADSLVEKTATLAKSNKARNYKTIHFDPTSSSRQWLSAANRSNDEIDIMPGWSERVGFESSFVTTSEHFDFFAKNTQKQNTQSVKLNEIKCYTPAGTSPLVFARWDDLQSRQPASEIFFSRDIGADLSEFVLVKATQYRFKSESEKERFNAQSKKAVTSEHVAAGIRLLKSKAKRVNCVSTVVARGQQTTITKRTPVTYPSESGNVNKHQDSTLLLDLTYKEKDSKPTLHMLYRDAGIAGSHLASSKKAPEFYTGRVKGTLDDSEQKAYFFPLYHSIISSYDMLLVEVTPLQ